MSHELSTLGKYHILERLAGGPLAEIYRAKTVGIAGFEKVQVLNRITATYADDPAFYKAFVEQAKLAFSLNHRNIVQVFEFGKADGHLFLATEYIPGVNLSDVMAQAREAHRQLPVGLTCYVMGEVASGLEYAHQKTDQHAEIVEVVHGGLSAHNVACSWEGSVKILEFGLASAAWFAASEQDRMPPVPKYLSPEQAAGVAPTAASDIFSFGVILWELLAGRPLFSQGAPDGREEVLRAIASMAVPALRPINRQVPVELDELTRLCLERDPGRRPSASHVHAALLKVQREVGAVIGSRTLATLLSELFSGQSELRDVRQVFETPAPRPLPGRSPETIRHLVDAAAELAEPRNPPAEPIGKARRPGRRSSADVLTAEALGSGSRLERAARGAGVLRAPRNVDEDVSVSTVSSSVSADLAVIPSEELIPIDEPFQPERVQAPIPPPGPAHPPSDEDAFDEASGLIETPGELIATSMQEGGGDTTSSTASLSATHVPSLRTVHARPGRAKHATRPLREKKRFIAACVLLDGPPAAREEALALVEDIAFKLDGLVHAHHADHLVAFFGLPTADENDIVSAARFAFDVQEAVLHLRTTLAETEVGTSAEDPLSVRVGIRMGTARLSDRPDRDAYQLQGNAIEETLLLAENAPDGQVHVGGTAARLASMHYLLAEVGALRSRGKPMRCYRLVAPLASQRRESSENLLVGREIETKALRTTWRQTVLSGGQQTVLILGEPGVGKSRLVDELLLRHTSDARAVIATATPHRRELANGLLVDLISSLGGEWRSNSSRSQTRLLERLRTLLRQSEAARDDVVDGIASMLDPIHSQAGSAADLNRRRLYHVIRAVLNAAASRGPLVLVVEDVQWADSSSMECLSTIVQRAQDAAGPTFVVLTARPEEGFNAHVFAGGAGFSQINLEELHEHERRQLIADNLEGQRTTDLVEAVERRAGGNPFYIRELCQVLREVSYTTISEIPATVQGVITSRVDRLPAFAKLILQHAAVIGPSFREGVLATLIGRNPARALASLRSRGFIVPGVAQAAPYQGAEEQSGSEQFEREWAFRHVLVQEVIYESLSSPDRRDLHLRVGEIMEQRARQASTDTPGEVARHLELGGATARASEYYLRAAAEAAAGYANKEAEDLYLRALRSSEDDTERQYRAYAGLERIHARLGLPEAQDADLKALAQLCAGDAARTADLRIRQATRLLRVGELYLALEATEAAEKAARDAREELLAAEALRLRGEAYDRLNDYPRATAAVQQAITMFELLDNPSRQARAQITLGRVMLAQARYDEALDNLSPALALVDRTGNRWLERVLRNSLAVVHFCRGNLAQALAEATSSLHLCVEFGDRAREGDISTVLGIIHLELGTYDTARRHLDRALLLHRETGSRWSEAETLVYAGLLRVADRNIRAALDVLEAAKSAADQMGAKYIAINARNALALALCERGAPNDAELAAERATEAFEKARAAALIVGEIPGLSRAARATAMLGDLDRARGLSRRAVELLDTQRHIEGREQEVYYTHYRILRAQGDDTARRYLELAHEALHDKLRWLQDPTHLASFSESVRLNAAIRRDHAACHT